MSLFNLDTIPEAGNVKSMHCRICDGKMEEKQKKWAEKFKGFINVKWRHTKKYQCSECKKEIFIREI